MSRQQIINYGITDASVTSSKLASSLQVGFLGVAAAPSGSNNVALSVAPSSLSGVNQFGIQVVATATTAATAGIIGISAQVVTPAASLTVVTGYSMLVYGPVLGSGSAITTQYGLYVASQGAAGITTAYGIFVAAQSGATTNVGIFNQGTTRFDANIGFSGAPPSYWGIYMPTTFSVTNNSGGAGVFGGVILQPTIITNYNNDTEVGLYVNPTFNDNGHSGVQHWSIYVPAGASYFYGGVWSGPSGAALPNVGDVMSSRGNNTGVYYMAGSTTVYMYYNGSAITFSPGLTSSALAAGAATALLGSYVSNPSWSTTVNNWVESFAQVTVTCTGGVNVRIELQLSLYHSVAGAGIYVGWGLDGSVSKAIGYANCPVAGYTVPFSGYDYAVPAAGSHRFSIFVYNASAGTLTFNPATYAQIHVIEERR